MVRLRAAIDRLLARMLVVIMAVMVANVVWQVFTRFVLSTPSSYTEELARYLLIWLTLLGGAYAAGQRLHLAIDLVTTRLAGVRRRRVERAIQATVFVFALATMVVGGTHLVYISFALAQVSAALQVSLGYVYLVVPVSGLVIMLYAAAAWLDAAHTSRDADATGLP
jgi:TRAP-type C4-dicarboxylate transport system permease small subunit